MDATRIIMTTTNCQSDIYINMDANQQCRLCLAYKSTDFLQNIFELSVKSELQSTEQILIDYMKIQICKDDNLPQNICDDCQDEIARFGRFIDKCRRSDKILRNKLNQDELIEKLDVEECVVVKKPHRRKYRIVFSKDQSNRSKTEEKPSNGVKLVLQFPRMKSNITEGLSGVNDDDLTSSVDCDDSNDNNELSVASDEGLFKCDQCGAVLCSKSSLKTHRAIHDSSRPYGCDKCDLKFKLKSHLVGHRRNIHEGLKKHSCLICKKKFFGSAQLKIHTMTHTKEYPHLCTHCGKRFSQQCYLRVHLKVHTGLKDLSCDLCDYTTGNHSAMRNHIKGIHEIDKKHQCVECGLRFVYPSGLTEHMSIHTGLKKHQCSACDKKFRTLSSLREHKRIHSDEKPYKCRFCDKIFRIVGHRTVHERVHTGEKPYGCVICDKKFQTRSNLNAHQRVHNKV